MKKAIMVGFLVIIMLFLTNCEKQNNKEKEVLIAQNFTPFSIRERECKFPLIDEVKVKIETPKKKQTTTKTTAVAKKKTTTTTKKKTTTNTTTKKVAYNVSELQSYAHNLVLSYGWSEYDFECLIKLWNRESGWNPNAVNKKSGACGIPQSLPCKKMATHGSDYKTNGKTQIRWGLDYIKARYGSPSNAWAHSQQKGWY